MAGLHQRGIVKGREMGSDIAILAKMHLARVQPHAFIHSLQTINQKSFAAVIKEKKYDQGVGGVVSYLVTGKGKHSHSLVCHVAAKELVLQSKKVFCTTLADLVLRGGEEVLDRLGVGYIVLSDLGANTQYYTLAQWDDVQALLLSHLGRGGGLILGMPDAAAVEFSYEFLDALAIFESILVV